MNDIDFELELIHRDEINVVYILKLLAKLRGASPEEQEKQKKELLNMLTGEAQLRSKKELIEKFIAEHLPQIEDVETIPAEFEKFWQGERMKAIEVLCETEQLKPEGLQKLIGEYLFTERKPLRDDVVGIMVQTPKLLTRKTIAERVITKIVDFVETFINGMGEG